MNKEEDSSHASESPYSRCLETGSGSRFQASLILTSVFYLHRSSFLPISYRDAFVPPAAKAGGVLLSIGLDVLAMNCLTHCVNR
jgi:hypothetical protein